VVFTKDIRACPIYKDVLYENEIVENFQWEIIQAPLNSLGWESTVWPWMIYSDTLTVVSIDKEHFMIVAQDIIY